MKKIKEIVKEGALGKMPFHSSLWEIRSHDKSLFNQNEISHKRFHKLITRVYDGSEEKEA